MHWNAIESGRACGVVAASVVFYAVCRVSPESPVGLVVRRSASRLRLWGANELRYSAWIEAHRSVATRFTASREKDGAPNRQREREKARKNGPEEGVCET